MSMWWIFGCTVANLAADSSATDDSVWEVTSVSPCDGGTTGPARFTDRAAAVGLDVGMTSYWGAPTSFGANVVVFDLDDDGDDDVLFGRNEGPPHLVEHVGEIFVERPLPFADFIETNGPVAALAAADLDGDFLPELLLAGTGRVWRVPNLGGLTFGAPELIYEDAGDMVPYYISMNLGDIDGDGDLDLALPSLDYVPRSIFDPYDEAYFGRGSWDLVLRNEGDGDFVLDARLSPEGTPGYALAAVFTDYDNDLDADLFVSTARIDFQGEIPGQALYRNDDGDFSVNVAPELYVDWELSGMGYDAFDANGDGVLDHCFTDTGPIRCFVSYEDGGFVESGTAWGLLPPTVEGRTWSGWSMELTDLDNDGNVDVWVAAGNEIHPRQVWPQWKGDHTQEDSDEHPDAVFWANGDGTFREVGGENGFDNATGHYGLVAADLDGNGAVEVIVAPSVGAPLAWWNECTEGGWVTVSLVGPPENTAGFGARAEFVLADRTERRQMQNVRGFGQSPPRWHVGLGGQSVVASIRILWPDGTESEHTDIPARSKVIVHHPHAAR